MANTPKPTKYYPHTDGFTIMEVVVTIGIFAIILSIILFLYSNYGKLFSSQQAIISAANSARTSMEEIQNYILSASQVATSTVIGGTAYNSGTTALVLQMPSVTGTGDVVSNRYDYVAFYSDNGSLYERIQPDPSSSRQARTKKLSDDLSSISFTYDTAAFANVLYVTVDVQTQATARGKTHATRLTQQINLRN